MPLEEVEVVEHSLLDLISTIYFLLLEVVEVVLLAMQVEEAQLVPQLSALEIIVSQVNVFQTMIYQLVTILQELPRLNFTQTILWVI